MAETEMTAEEERDALAKLTYEANEREKELSSIAEELAEALRPFAQTALGSVWHESARAALARYSNLHKGEHDGT